MLRSGLIHLKVDVQSAVHPCVEKHWSTAQTCGRLHKSGGLKPQNNQRFLLRLATTRQDRVKPINNMYETKQNRGHRNIQFITPWSSFECFHSLYTFSFCWYNYQSKITCSALTARRLCRSLLIWLKSVIGMLYFFFKHCNMFIMLVDKKSHRYFPCKFMMFPTIWILFVVIASIP